MWHDAFPRLPFSHLVASIIIAAVVSGIAVFAELPDASLLIQIVTFLSLLLPAAALLLCGFPQSQTVLGPLLQVDKRAQNALLIVLLASFSLGSLAGTIDPYAWILVSVMLFGVFRASTGRFSEQPGAWDLLIWVLLLMIFDYRLTSELWFGADGIGYIWWSLSISLVLIVVWQFQRELPLFKVRFIPNWRDLIVAVVCSVLALAVLLPLGLWLDFIQYNPPQGLDPVEAIGRFVGIAFTIAIPEELFFRGVLMLLLFTFIKNKLWAILLSSLFFGVFHWNNVTGLSTQLSYVLLATIAGFFYAQAYIRSGNNLLAAVLTHTTVDWVWQMYLQ